MPVGIFCYLIIKHSAIPKLEKNSKTSVKVSNETLSEYAQLFSNLSELIRALLDFEKSFKSIIIKTPKSVPIGYICTQWVRDRDEALATS
jgi:hypothetical protein